MKKTRKLDWQKARGGRIDPLRAPRDGQPMTNDNRIDEAIAESFPASDPPSWTGGIDPAPPSVKKRRRS